MSYRIHVNGTDHEVDADADTPLLWVLRDTLNMTGTKFGCGVAQCGACTVHADGAAIRSCQLPLERVGTLAITTIEGIGETDMANACSTSGCRSMYRNAVTAREDRSWQRPRC